MTSARDDILDTIDRCVFGEKWVPYRMVMVLMKKYYKIHFEEESLLTFFKVQYTDCFSDDHPSPDLVKLDDIEGFRRYIDVMSL